MAQASNKSSTRLITGWFRKLVARPAAEFSRTGKIAQTLFDATQLQRKKEKYLQAIGEIALKHYKEGKIQDIRIDRILAKMENVDRVLDREELLMKSYHAGGDLKGALHDEEEDGTESDDGTLEDEVMESEASKE